MFEEVRMKRKIEQEEEPDEDADIEFSGKSSTFKELVMTQLGRISQLSSKELRGGYFTTTTTKSGAEKEIYVEDTRSALQNGIYCLATLLTHKYDQGMKKAFNVFEAEIKKQKDTFLKATALNENEILGEAFYENGKDKVRLEELKISRLRIYQELFKQLCKMLGRQNFLEIGGTTFE